LNLICDQPYYLTVGAYNEGSLWGESRVNNDVVLALTLPTGFTCRW